MYAFRLLVHPSGQTGYHGHVGHFCECLSRDLLFLAILHSPKPIEYQFCMWEMASETSIAIQTWPTFPRFLPVCVGVFCSCSGIYAIQSSVGTCAIFGTFWQLISITNRQKWSAPWPLCCSLIAVSASVIAFDRREIIAHCWQPPGSSRARPTHVLGHSWRPRQAGSWPGSRAE